MSIDDTVLTVKNLYDNGYDFESHFADLQIYSKGDINLMVKPIKNRAHEFDLFASYKSSQPDSMVKGLYESIQLDLFENNESFKYNN